MLITALMLGRWLPGSGVGDVVAKYADALADRREDVDRLRTKTVPIRFVEYDWRLNDIGR